MIKKITDVSKMITWIIAAIISILSFKWYWDIFKPIKKADDEEKENDDYVED